MHILIKIINSKSIDIDIEQTAKIEDLKAKIYEKEKIPPEQQKIIFSNTQLENGNTLQDYSIQQDSALYMIIRVVDDPNPLNYITIWKDDNIDNEENSRYRKELEEKAYSGVYFTKVTNEALNIIKTNNNKKIKLITNGGVGLTGKTLIEEARKITGKTSVSLVFARSPQHLQWITQMENVLFTTSPDMFKKFVELKMDKDSIIKFIDELQKANNTKFKINESNL